MFPEETFGTLEQGDPSLLQLDNIEIGYDIALVTSFLSFLTCF